MKSTSRLSFTYRACKSGSFSLSHQGAEAHTLPVFSRERIPSISSFSASFCFFNCLRRKSVAEGFFCSSSICADKAECLCFSASTLVGCEDIKARDGIGFLLINLIVVCYVVILSYPHDRMQKTTQKLKTPYKIFYFFTVSSTYFFI